MLPALLTLVFNVITTIFDVVSYPLYYIWYQPWKKLDERRISRSTIEFISQDEVVVKPKIPILVKEIIAKQQRTQNVYELFKEASKKYGEKPCSGTRKIIKEVIEKDARNVPTQKLEMEGMYRWQSYETIRKRIDNVSVGLVSGTCLNSGDVVLIYADTCLEWFISALACFRINCTVATVYTNLGENGVGHCINIAKPKLIITTRKLLPKLLNILGKESKDIKDIIFFRDPLCSVENECTRDGPWIIQSFDILEDLGTDLDEKNAIDEWKAAEEADTAIIMFTSGSTGTPKGVILSHGNVIESILVYQAHICELMGRKDLSAETYIAYLPMAHIFELAMELSSYCSGVKVGYSSPFTLTDKSPKICSWQKGDLSMVRPTFMAAVPLVLDRVYKTIISALNKKNQHFARLFQLCYEYKSYWYERGFDTPLLNALLFRKFKDILGGKLKFLVVGSAPLSNEIQRFFKTVICQQTSLGYALTESSSCGMVSNRGDEIGEVGIAAVGIVIKLESWKEGGYLVNDKEGPRGEILLSSKAVAKGYYKVEDDASNSAFFMDNNGTKWFRTGDIGHLNPLTGSMRIIDRRKDLIKLQMGEYVSLSKVENEIKMHPIVDMVCVYADPTKTATIAFIIPDDAKLCEFANQCNVFSPAGGKRADLCKNQVLKEHILKDITTCVSKRLEKFEVPKIIALVDEPWTPETGLVTAAMKLKRKAIQSAYQNEINKMYRQVDELKALT